MNLVTTDKTPGPSLPQISRLLEVMAILRDPDSGCEWDIQQTFETIAPYTIEEAYEVADAIERNDLAALCEELGDLLLQVVFHAQMAQDQGLFDFEDVAAAIADKMIARHPHVFGDTRFDSVEAQKAHWEKLKQQERQGKSADKISELDGVALPLPALTRAEKIQKRASRVGFDWPAAAPVVEKLNEEMLELQQAMAEDSEAGIEEELGDVLFTVTNLARHLKVDPEQALKKSTAKFEKRFRSVEQAANNNGHEITELNMPELDELWDRAKLES